MARLAFLLACAAFRLAITRAEQVLIYHEKSCIITLHSGWHVYNNVTSFTQALSYKLQLSGGGPQIFPGGAFKPANTDNFPASKHLSGEGTSHVVVKHLLRVVSYIRNCIWQCCIGHDRA